MNTPSNIDPAVVRFVRLTAYFLWRLLEQPEGIVLKALRGHPKYRNTSFLLNFGDAEIGIVNQGCADSFADMLLLPNKERNLDNTLVSLRKHLITSLEAIGKRERALELGRGDGLLGVYMEMYANSVYSVYTTFAPWITMVMMSLPEVWNTKTDLSSRDDYLAMSSEFWSVAKSLFTRLPGLMSFVITEYRSFLASAIESYLGLIILGNSGVISEGDVENIVAQLYTMGINDLKQHLA